jgi:ribosomal protein L24E
MAASSHRLYSVSSDDLTGVNVMKKNSLLFVRSDGKKFFCASAKLFRFNASSEVDLTKNPIALRGNAQQLYAKFADQGEELLLPLDMKQEALVALIACMQAK